jgi:hypothetical protein
MSSNNRSDRYRKRDIENNKMIMAKKLAFDKSDKLIILIVLKK